MQKKKICANFQRIVQVFTQKFFNMLSNIWVWDPGSGKSYSGSRIQGSKRHRIPDPQHWFLRTKLLCIVSVSVPVPYLMFKVYLLCRQNASFNIKYRRPRGNLIKIGTVPYLQGACTHIASSSGSGERFGSGYNRTGALESFRSRSAMIFP
jgi:hypothetical protein